MPEERDFACHRDNSKGHETGGCSDDGCKDKDHSIGGFRNDVFLKRKLYTVSQTLHQAEWTGAVWPKTHLHTSHNASLAPD